MINGLPALPLNQLFSMTSSKCKKGYDKGRRYNCSSEKTFPRLKKAGDESEDGYCKLCHVAIVQRLSNSENDVKTDKHKKKRFARAEQTVEALYSSSTTEFHSIGTANVRQLRNLLRNHRSDNTA